MVVALPLETKNSWQHTMGTDGIRAHDLPPAKMANVGTLPLRHRPGMLVVCQEGTEVDSSAVFFQGGGVYATFK